MLSRRSALAVLGTAGIGTAVFQRALAATAGDGAVSPQMVADAEWVAGIKLTDPQREAVVNAFKFAREDLGHVRPIELDNSLLPGLRFAPFDQSRVTSRPARLRGQDISGTGPSTGSDPDSRPDSDEDLAFSSIRQLGNLLAQPKDFVGGIDEVLSGTAPALRPAAQMCRDLHGRAGAETSGARRPGIAGEERSRAASRNPLGASRTSSPIRATPRRGASGNIATA